MFTLEVLASRAEDIKQKLDWCIPDFVITYLDTHTIFRCNFNSLAYTGIDSRKFSEIFYYIASLKEPFILIHEHHSAVVGKYTPLPLVKFKCTRYENIIENDFVFNWNEQVQLYTTNKLLQMTG